MSAEQNRDAMWNQSRGATVGTGAEFKGNIQSEFQKQFTRLWEIYVQLRCCMSLK